MKACLQCRKLFQESKRACNQCQGEIAEITLGEALKLTRRASFKENIDVTNAEAPDTYRQYLIRQYLKDGSLFLHFDLCKNRLKHGRKPKRFLIQSIDFTALFNIPWVVFNILSSNMFHLQYSDFCEKCQCKIIPGCHAPKECDYNVEYFNILNDIISGSIIDTKLVYEQHDLESQKKGERSAYHDLFLRKVRSEVFFDILSIGSSVAFWLFLIVYVVFPFISVWLENGF